MPANITMGALLASGGAVGGTGGTAPPPVQSGSNYLLLPSAHLAKDGLPYADWTNSGYENYFAPELGRKLTQADLTVHAGSFTTTADNQVIYKMWITGQLNVKHKGVKVLGCLIERTNSSTPFLIFGVTDHGFGLTGNWTMEHTTLVAHPTGGEVTMLNTEWAQIKWCDISGGTDAWDPWGLNNVIFEHNYVHDLTPYGGAHSDCIQIVGGAGPASIQHNTLLSTNPSYPIGAYAGGDTSVFPGNTSGLQIGELTGNIGYVGDVDFKDNLCDGGNYMFNANWGNDGTHDLVGNINIDQNRLGRDQRYGLFVHIPAGHNVIIGVNWWDNDGTVAT